MHINPIEWSGNRCFFNDEIKQSKEPLPSSGDSIVYSYDLKSCYTPPVNKCVQSCEIYRVKVWYIMEIKS